MQIRGHSTPHGPVLYGHISPVAYGYCLQARLAIRFRLRDDPQYGDEKIRQNIENQAEEIRKVYTAKARTLRSPEPFWLEWVGKEFQLSSFLEAAERREIQPPLQNRLRPAL